MQANLTLKASLQKMTTLNGSNGSIEKAGKEPITTADEFDGRNGYNPSFLEGWEIPLPLPVREKKDDVRMLRKGKGFELKYQNFSVIMSMQRRMPMLTAVNIDGSQSRRVPRITTWSFDGRLNKEDQWGDALYDTNALDRGHMVRREDPVWGTVEEARIANMDTFHFTNSCPQMAGVNQKTWVGLENYILSHAREDSMKVNVFTGPVFSENDLEYRGALIPNEFWKVVTIVTEEGRPSATAYKVSQKKELEELEFVFAGYKTFQISIREAMELSGIDFSNLLEFDGFSQHEMTGNARMQEQIDELNKIRI